MSKRHRLEKLDERIHRLKASIEADQAELRSLTKRANLMRAETAIENMTPGVRNALLQSGMGLNRHAE